jgi:hypothetical protein
MKLNTRNIVTRADWKSRLGLVLVGTVVLANLAGCGNRPAGTSLQADTPQTGSSITTACAHCDQTPIVIQRGRSASSGRYTVAIVSVERLGKDLQTSMGREAHAQGQWLIVRLRATKELPPTQFVGQPSAIPQLLGARFILRSFDGTMHISQAQLDLLQGYSESRGGVAIPTAVAPGPAVEYYLCFDIPPSGPNLYLWYPESVSSTDFPLLAIDQ